MAHPDEDLLSVNGQMYWQEDERLRQRAQRIDAERTAILIEINNRSWAYEQQLAQDQPVTREMREALAELRQQAEDLRIIQAHLPALLEKARSKWLRCVTRDVEAAWREDAARLAEIAKDLERGPLAKQLKLALPEVRRMAQNTLRRANMIGLTVDSLASRSIGGFGWCLPLAPPATPDDLLMWITRTPRYAALMTRNGDTA